MRERPILLNGDMVRAVLNGSKTQTRRIIKNQRVGDNWSVQPAKNPRIPGHTHDWWLPTATQPYSALPRCPYGAVGDRLWVREAHSIQFKPTEILPGVAWYRESDNGRQWEGQIRWHPSIHMPRWASRITLEITGVRVERLQDISAEDAAAEGITGRAKMHDFGVLWSSLYGYESWQANPWVWVIEFKRVEVGNNG